MDIEELSDRQRNILRLWESGLSGSKIAKELGTTKSAVLGAVYRMRAQGFVTRQHETSKTIKTLKQAVKNSAVSVSDKIVSLQSTRKVPYGFCTAITLRKDGNRKAPRKPKFSKLKGDEVTLMSLNHITCRYINGEIDGLDTAYCGRTVTRGVYCADHALLCYREPPQKVTTYADNASTEPAPAG